MSNIGSDDSECSAAGDTTDEVRVDTGPVAKRPCVFGVGTPPPTCATAGRQRPAGEPIGAALTLLKLRSTSAGSVDYHIQARDLQPGPSSLEDIASWPLGVLDALWAGDHGAARRQRTVALLQSGVILHSDCSGKLTPEACFHIMVKAMAQRLAPLPEDSIIAWRASDNSPLCQRVINGHKLCPVHVFDGLLGKLPTAHQIAIEKLRPQPTDSDNERATAFDRIDRYLHDRAHTLYGRTARATNCLKHPGKACLLSWQDPIGISPHLRPLTLAIAGTPCRPWTRYAAKKTHSAGPAHTDMEAWHLWKNEVRCQNYDIIVFENSDNFVPTLFTSSLPPQYLVKYCIWSAHEQGWPMRRRRFFAVALNLESLLWLGDSSQDLTIPFLNLVGRTVCLEGDAFVKLDAADAIALHRQGLARTRGFYPSKERAMDLSLVDLLPSGQARCYQQMQERFASGFHKVGLGGSYLCDVTQNPHRCRDGALLPTVARTSHIVSVSQGHSYTPAEIDFAMGWPTIMVPKSGNDAFDMICGASASGADLTQNERRSLAGNGMVLPQLSMWLWFVFGFTGKRATYEKLMPPVHSGFVPIDDDEAEGPEDVVG